jgi:light-regulated signal transduction histidine kinase (bacteriophytochrome)
LANTVLENLRQEAPEREIEFSVAERLVIDGDRRLLLILLENILGNAWKYTRKCSVAYIEFSFDPERSVYSVRDNGTGFDMNYAEKLFRPFQRLHSTAQFEGNGLGLCIVRRIVERHGGRVWIESAEDRGTAIHFTLNEAAAEVFAKLPS